MSIFINDIIRFCYAYLRAIESFMHYKNKVENQIRQKDTKELKVIENVSLCHHLVNIVPTIELFMKLPLFILLNKMNYGM